MNDKTTLLKKLKEFKLGLKRGTVGLIDYQNAWEQGYRYMHGLIVETLRNPGIQIEHIGSTAIPEIADKPIVDIVIIFNREQGFCEESQKLEYLGFKAKGDYGILERHFFAYYDFEELNDYVHIHAFPQGNQNITKLTNFRDRLCHSPQLRTAYCNFKKELLASGISRKDYPDAKTKFVRRVLEESS